MFILLVTEVTKNWIQKMAWGVH